jgi:hypothetical protein
MWLWWVVRRAAQTWALGSGGGACGGIDDGTRVAVERSEVSGPGTEREGSRWREKRWKAVWEAGGGAMVLRETEEGTVESGREEGVAVPVMMPSSLFLREAVMLSRAMVSVSAATAAGSVSSSARSVAARLEVPRTSWMLRVRKAAKAIMTTKPMTGGLVGGRSTKGERLTEDSGDLGDLDAADGRTQG